MQTVISEAPIRTLTFSLDLSAAPTFSPAWRILLWENIVFSPRLPESRLSLLQFLIMDSTCRTHSGRCQRCRKLTMEMGLREDFQVYPQPAENLAFPLTGQYPNHDVIQPHTHFRRDLSLACADFTSATFSLVSTNWDAAASNDLYLSVWGAPVIGRSLSPPIPSSNYGPVQFALTVPAIHDRVNKRCSIGRSPSSSRSSMMPASDIRRGRSTKNALRKGLERDTKRIGVHRERGPPRSFWIRGSREASYAGSPTRSGQPSASPHPDDAQGGKLQQRATLSHRAHLAR